MHGHWRCRSILDFKGNIPTTIGLVALIHGYVELMSTFLKDAPV